MQKYPMSRRILPLLTHDFLLIGFYVSIAHQLGGLFFITFPILLVCLMVQIFCEWSYSPQQPKYFVSVLALMVKFQLYIQLETQLALIASYLCLIQLSIGLRCTSVLPGFLNISVVFATLQSVLQNNVTIAISTMVIMVGLLIINILWIHVFQQPIISPQDIQSSSYGQNLPTMSIQIANKHKQQTNKEFPQFLSLSNIDVILSKLPFLSNQKFATFLGKVSLEAFEKNFEYDEINIRQEETEEDEELFNKLLNINVLEYSSDCTDILRSSRHIGGYSRVSQRQSALDSSSEGSALRMLYQNRQDLSMKQAPHHQLNLGDILETLLEASRTNDLTKKLYRLENLQSEDFDLSTYSIELIFLPSNDQTIMLLIFKDQLKANHENTEELLANIFSSVSHEFGTHLNLLATLSESGSEDVGIPEDVRKSYFSPMLINSQLLNLMLNSLRDYMLILQNSFILKIESFNIVEEIQQIIDCFKGALDIKDIDFQVNPQLEVLQNLVNSDKERFRQTFYSIFANAVRFTPNGKITVELNLITKFSSQIIQVSVTDSGIGMAYDEIYRLEQLLKHNGKVGKISKNSVGCGLGLKISNQIALKLSGQFPSTIEFSSIHQTGSSFKFYIENVQLQRTHDFHPSNSFVGAMTITLLNSFQYMEENRNVSMKNMIDHQSQAQLRRGSNNTHNSPLHALRNYHSSQFGLRNFEGLDLSHDNESNPQIISVPTSFPKFQQQIIKYALDQLCCSKILIIDDEYFNIMAIQMIVTNKFKALSDHAFNGKEALAKVKHKQSSPCRKCGNRGYVTYFIDINMPIMDGFQTVTELKSLMGRGILERGICIANTAFVDLDTKVKCLESGMDFYISKPIRVSQLTEFIRTSFLDQEQMISR